MSPAVDRKNQGPEIVERPKEYRFRSLHVPLTARGRGLHTFFYEI